MSYVIYYLNKLSASSEIEAYIIYMHVCGVEKVSSSSCRPQQQCPKFSSSPKQQIETLQKKHRRVRPLSNTTNSKTRGTYVRHTSPCILSCMHAPYRAKMKKKMDTITEVACVNFRFQKFIRTIVQSMCYESSLSLLLFFFEIIPIKRYKLLNFYNWVSPIYLNLIFT